MFSFFKKKKDPFTVRIKEYEQPRFVAGMQTPTAKRSYRKDVSALQTSFNGKRDQLQNRTNPSGTMVIFSLPDSAGSFTYFVGDLVDTAQQADCFVVRELPAGKYAHISIDFKVPTDLPLKMAKAKKYFFHTWLPSSGYKMLDGIESCELYDRRSKIALPSMELIFLLQSKQ